MSREPLLTVAELAAFLAVKPKTIYEWIAKEQIPCIRLARKAIRFDREAVLKAVAERPAKGQ